MVLTEKIRHIKRTTEVDDDKFLNWLRNQNLSQTVSFKRLVDVLSNHL